MLKPLLSLLLLLTATAWAMPEQVVATGSRQVIIRRTLEENQALLSANRGRPRQAVLNDQSLEAFPFAPIDGRRALAVRG